MLKRLGAGESIAAFCERQRWTRELFDTWWQEECRRRLPNTKGAIAVPGIRGPAKIARDRWGVPHIQAFTEGDLFFAFGYATAQDRLFQLDYLRRKARGRLAEILGPEALESDVLYRTIGLSQIAEREWESLPAETRELVSAYAAGVNAVIQACGDLFPIEFDLLDYPPDPWLPQDCLAIAGEFRWYLTGRFPVIVVPELVKRALGAGPLYEAFLTGEEDGESIMPPGSYSAAKGFSGRVGATVADRDAGHGSNNWVLAGSRTTTGRPIVASDPHVPYGADSIWHEVHLRAGSFHVAGVAYAGMPAVMVGRTQRVAWGVTNNICSQRDLYQEQTDPGHPGCFLYDGRWEPATERREIIKVRGAEPVQKTIRSSRNGPLVDEILPAPARGTGPVSLRWLGAEPCGWLTALIGMNRASTITQLREATRPWHVPTFNLVFADADGHIGHQCVGRIPWRQEAERGYRPGWDPRHQWRGFIPFEAMPRQTDPPRGFVVTANNRVAPDDYPYPLSGTWISGHRARRIREQIEGKPRWTADDCRALQLDTHSGRAAECVPPLVALLETDEDPRVQEAVRRLREWDFAVETESIPATIFNVFFVHWCRAVAAERLPADCVEFAAPSAGGLAAALLRQDDCGWFERRARNEAVREAMVAALDELTKRLGPQISDWRWGRLHTVLQKHFLSHRGDLGRLLDVSGTPVRGDGTTVCSSSPDPDYAAYLGADYRMVADLADPQQGLWAIKATGVSGHPGSPHYKDQHPTWAEGGFHYASLIQAPQDGDVLELRPRT
jgi:penicillin amidase